MAKPEEVPFPYTMKEGSPKDKQTGLFSVLPCPEASFIMTVILTANWLQGRLSSLRAPWTLRPALQGCIFQFMIFTLSQTTSCLDSTLLCSLHAYQQSRWTLPPSSPIRSRSSALSAQPYHLISMLPLPNLVLTHSCRLQLAVTHPSYQDQYALKPDGLFLVHS